MEYLKIPCCQVFAIISADDINTVYFLRWGWGWRWEEVVMGGKKLDRIENWRGGGGFFNVDGITRHL